MAYRLALANQKGFYNCKCLDLIIRCLSFKPNVNFLTDQTGMVFLYLNKCLGSSKNSLILVYVRPDREISTCRAAEREHLTMEESWQLLWQGQRGELILVPLQQAHLLPVTHKALSHHKTLHKRKGWERCLMRLIDFYFLCGLTPPPTHWHPWVKQRTLTHPARRLLHVW